MHYTTHRPTPDLVICDIVAEHIGKYGKLMEIFKKGKASWFVHVARAKGTLANTILRGNVEGERSRGRPARE